MPVLNPNEIFFTPFEPKVQNRFIMFIDGFPAYVIKGVSGMGFSQEEMELKCLLNPILITLIQFLLTSSNHMMVTDQLNEESNQ